MQQDPKHKTIIFKFVAIVFGFLFICSINTSHQQRVRGISPSAILSITPDGYKLAKHIPWQTDQGQSFRITAFSDSNKAEPVRPVMLLLLSWQGKWVVHDSVLLHHSSGTATNYDAPNYFTDMSRVQVDSHFLILVRTTVFWGGSGSGQYFDFYDLRDHKLVLLRSFLHGKMERYYFALYNGVIYDADLVNKRGARRHKSFVYTCYLNVKKYHFDGREITEIDSQRLCEKQGPWFLCDTYRFMSIERALKRGEIFNKNNDIRRPPNQFKKERVPAERRRDFVNSTQQVNNILPMRSAQTECRVH